MKEMAGAVDVSSATRNRGMRRLRHWLEPNGRRHIGSEKSVSTSKNLLTGSQLMRTIDADDTQFVDFFALCTSSGQCIYIYISAALLSSSWFLFSPVLHTIRFSIRLPPHQWLSSSADETTVLSSKPLRYKLVNPNMVFSNA